MTEEEYKIASAEFLSGIEESEVEWPDVMGVGPDSSPTGRLVDYSTWRQDMSDAVLQMEEESRKLGIEYADGY